MGWSSYHRDKGMSNLDWLRSELVRDPTWGQILDAATVAGTIYAAWKLGPAHGGEDGRVIGLVVLTRWSRGEYNFAYKNMTDSMGPAEDRCPARILDLLDEPTNDWAREWRLRCRAELAKRENARQVKAGQVVRFARPLTFTNGAELDTFVFEKGSNFRSVHGGRYRITGWRSSTFEIVAT